MAEVDAILELIDNAIWDTSSPDAMRWALEKPAAVDMPPRLPMCRCTLTPFGEPLIIDDQPAGDRVPSARMRRRVVNWYRWLRQRRA